MYSYETDSFKRIISKIKTGAGSSIISVTAFGSRVRGDFSEDSDMDVLVVVDKKSPKEISFINDIFYEEEIKSGIPFSVTVVPLHSFNSNKRFKTGFYQNIKKDGVVLYGINP
jgi:predicted nucleotidyltransferase